MIAEQDIKDAGYKAETFFFSTDGGGDKDNCEIWVKDNAALCEWNGSWFCYPYNKLTFASGFLIIYEIQHMDDIKAIIK